MDKTGMKCGRISTTAGDVGVRKQGSDILLHQPLEETLQYTEKKFMRHSKRG